MSNTLCDLFKLRFKHFINYADKISSKYLKFNFSMKELNLVLAGSQITSCKCDDPVPDLS